MKYIDERYYLQKNKQGYECRRKKISTALRVPVCNYHYQEIKEKSSSHKAIRCLILFAGIMSKATLIVR